MNPHTVRCEAVIDLAAVAANVRALRGRLARATRLMAVVKADGYGHGAAPVAATAVAAGADMLGVATVAEAIAISAVEPSVPVLCWLWGPAEELGPALSAGVHLAVSSHEQLRAVLAAAAAGSLPTAPTVHLKIDTGLGRNGVARNDFPALLGAAAAAHRAGLIRVTGLMSHLASADVPGDRSVGLQAAEFGLARRAVADQNLPVVAHLANTAATIDHPALHCDMVRVGIGLYGLSPVADPAGLRPAMTLRASVALVKRVPAGHGVSYGLTYRTSGPATLALVPMGYADGIPRAASSTAQVLLGGRRRTIAGRVAMDQFVVDCGDDSVQIGDDVLIFGPGEHGEPTARDWADACHTIDYEIVTRIGGRTPRRYLPAERTELAP